MTSKRHPEIEMILEGDKGDYLAQIDASDFGRVVSNIINNSIEAIELNPKIEIRFTKPSSARICVEIKDYGIGIPKDVLTKIGYQEVTFGKTHGSGLGTLHARSTLDRFGGSFTIDSTEGLGTLVTLTLRC